MTFGQLKHGTVSFDRLQEMAPAVFATTPAITTKARYRFISTAQVVQALMNAGFAPSQAKQTLCRSIKRDPQFAKHMLRFRMEQHHLIVGDCVPEIILINSHDGTSSYQLRAGLYRLACSNGLIVSIGDFELISVPHRGNVIEDVVQGALTIASRFSGLTQTIENMRGIDLSADQRDHFAQQALRLRYPRAEQHVPITIGRVLEAHRAADAGNDVWRVYNILQENLLRGGVIGQAASGRVTRTRSITAIRETVRLNEGLWQLAMTMLR
jgi:hypothetical protein